MAIEVDIKKAFDTLEWRFLLKVLKCFGFSDLFGSWINNILGSARISILINGYPEGFFSCSRGVRQGDPFSPLLFNIAEDFLSRYLSALCTAGAVDPMRASRNVQVPSHLLYADDVLLFCKATRMNAEALKYAFDLYGRLSGQIVSTEKSKIYFGKGVSVRLKDNIHTYWDLRNGFIPFIYLGVPFFKGKPKKEFLLP